MYDNTIKEILDSKTAEFIADDEHCDSRAERGIQRL